MASGVGSQWEVLEQIVELFHSDAYHFLMTWTRTAFNIAERELKAIWEIFCHLIIPCVFIGALLLDRLHLLDLTWQTIVVLAIAMSPFILVILTRYTRRFKGAGVEMESAVTDSGNLPPPPAPPPNEPAIPPLPTSEQGGQQATPERRNSRPHYYPGNRT